MHIHRPIFLPLLMRYIIQVPFCSPCGGIGWRINAEPAVFLPWSPLGLTQAHSVIDHFYITIYHMHISHKHGFIERKLLGLPPLMCYCGPDLVTSLYPYPGTPFLWWMRTTYVCTVSTYILRANTSNIVTLAMFKWLNYSGRYSHNKQPFLESMS